MAFGRRVHGHRLWVKRGMLWGYRVEVIPTDSQCRNIRVQLTRFSPLAYHQAARRLVMFGGLQSRRGLLLRADNDWQTIDAQPSPPRQQCSPLVWSGELNGLVLHGGELQHGGRQFDTTWLLTFATC